MPDSTDQFPASTQPLPGPRPADVAPSRPALPLLAPDAEAIPLFDLGRHDRLVRFLVFAGIFTLYLMNAGSFGLWDPWETHYGEVARNMLETYDWVNPWWGYARKIGTEPIGGEWFYSKPIYIFWAELTFLKLIGLTDWAFRLPQALLGASMGSMVYFTVERVAGRTYALLGTVVVALSPFVYMVSRQAQTDMPFVATLTIGLLFFALAFFSRRERFGPRGFAWATAAFVGFFLLNIVPQLIIISTDLFDPNAGAGQTGLPALLDTIQQNGVWHLIFYGPVALGLLASVLLPILRQRKTAEGWSPTFRDRWIRRFYLLSGYMLFAQATYAKGLLGFMLPGAVLLFYLIATRTWGLLSRIELLRGIPLFFLTVSPWYVAMFCRHGMPYYQRFFIHDHFNRVGAGVHEIDTGTFEYFAKWLGYGLFPWAAFIPLALIAAIGYVRGERNVDTSDPEAFRVTILGQFKVLALLWFIVSFFVFTLSATRFHHYILPGVPALGMLVGFYLAELRIDRSVQSRLHVVLALIVFVALAVNLAGDYQNLRNMFTYKYDRPLPENLPTDWNAAVLWPSDQNPIQTWAQTPFGKHVGPMVAQVLSIQWFRYETFVKVAAALGLLGVILMLGNRLRTIGLWVLGGTAALTAFWALDYYMPTLAPHWSQKYLFEAYYGDCHMHPNPPAIEEAYTPLVRKVGLGFIADFLDAKPKRVCEEDIVSWLITWRGETFYSSNEIRPLNKATQLEPYLREMNRGKSFYALLERGRTSGFESKLKAESKKLRDEGLAGFTRVKDWDCSLISNDSAYFVLARCNPSQDDGSAPVKRPVVKPAKPAVRPAEPGDRGSSPNPNF
jgi:4-amino-4-deoxy-L-arabinose transferase-like glycosyltransferase